MKYPKNKDWLIWLFEFRWWWWKSQILFQVETVNQPWTLLTVWKRSWHPTKKYSVGIILLMRTWASRNRKYRQPTWYFLFRYFLWSRKYRVGSVGGGSTLVTNDQPSYFQPTREMAHSIAWEIERWHNSKGVQSNQTKHSNQILHTLRDGTIQRETNPSVFVFSPPQLVYCLVQSSQTPIDWSPAQWFEGLTGKRSSYQTSIFPACLHTHCPLFWTMVSCYAFLQASKSKYLGTINIEHGFSTRPFQKDL